jgi:glycyl-tRNA synthetase beta chain
VGDLVPDLSTDLLAFFHDRLKVHLRAEDITHDVIDAALSKPPVDDLALVVARARALQAFLKTPDGENLVQGYRRAANILTQAEEKDGVEYRFGADPKFAETDEERALFKALDTATARSRPRWRPRISPPRCRTWPPCARPSTRFSRPCRSMPTTRSCAATA